MFNSSCSMCASKYLSDMIPWLVCFLLVAYWNRLVVVILVDYKIIFKDRPCCLIRELSYVIIKYKLHPSWCMLFLSWIFDRLKFGFKTLLLVHAHLFIDIPVKKFSLFCGAMELCMLLQSRMESIRELPKLIQFSGIVHLKSLLTMHTRYNLILRFL